MERPTHIAGPLPGGGRQVIRDQWLRARHHALRALSRVVFRQESRPDLRKLGSSYGGWIVPLSLLSPDSVCYLAGVGEDITFDLALIDHVGCHVWALDPTPRASLHVEEHARGVDRFHFDPVGLWSEPATLRFYAPQDPMHVSHSVVNLQRTDTYFEAPCLPLAELMEKNGHDEVDLLKLDIEGAEHAVIEQLLRVRLRPRILAVEFDQPTSWLKIRRTIRALHEDGYRLAAIDVWNYTFVRD